jgi:hypothetical protein
VKQAGDLDTPQPKEGAQRKENRVPRQRDMRVLALAVHFHRFDV